jgi:RNA polymerase sigma-70 factor, ECF subfamily
MPATTSSEPISPAAIAEVYRPIAARAGAAARCYCLDNEVDDAVAEGFVRALTSLEQLRDPACLEKWIIRCVIRAAIDLRRRRLRQHPHASILDLFERSSPPSESAAESVLWCLDQEEVAAALRALPTRARLLLQLRYESSLSVRQIATLLNEPEGSVRRRCFEARRAARAHYLRTATSP